MSRRGRSTSIGKFAKLDQARRVSEIRMLGELLRYEQRLDRDGPPAWRGVECATTVAAHSEPAA